MKRAGYTIIGLLIVMVQHASTTFAPTGDGARIENCVAPGRALNSDERCIERTTLWASAWLTITEVLYPVNTAVQSDNLH